MNHLMNLGTGLLLSFSTSLFAVENPLCGPRVATVEKASKRAIPLAQVFRTAIGPETKLVVFGEDHDQYQAKRGLMEMYRMIKKEHPRLNCVFIELGEEHQPLLEQFLKKERSKKDFILAMVKSNWNGRPFTQEYLEIFSDRMDAWMDLATLAHADGSSVLYDDVTAEQNRQYYYQGIESTGPRNHFMAELIERNFDSGKCDLAMKIVGHQHILSPTPTAARTEADKLQEILKSRSIPTVAMHFTNTSYEALSPFFYLDFDYVSYMMYYYEIEVDPADPAHADPLKKFNDYETDCLSKAVPFLPKVHVAVPASPEILPAYGPSGIMNGQTYGRAARMDQVDYWVWLAGTHERKNQ
ncbi:MAG TPA: hypothetical protein VNJ01_01410 [Bacteriovoracaceae bacterium]|nr:hypothetical protein [Bacteriovoracaceae bacterium]